MVPRPLSLHTIPAESGQHTNVSLLQRFHQCNIDLARFDSLPPLMPQKEAFRVVRVDMHVPFNIYQPVHFEDIELANRYAAHFRPGPVLEGIVIQKFGTKHESDGKHAVYLSTPMVVFALV